MKAITYNAHNYVGFNHIQYNHITQTKLARQKKINNNKRNSTSVDIAYTYSVLRWKENPNHSQTKKKRLIEATLSIDRVANNANNDFIQIHWIGNVYDWQLWLKMIECPLKIKIMLNIMNVNYEYLYTCHPFQCIRSFITHTTYYLFESGS